MKIIEHYPIIIDHSFIIIDHCAKMIDHFADHDRSWSFQKTLIEPLNQYPSTQDSNRTTTQPCSSQLYIEMSFNICSNGDSNPLSAGVYVVSAIREIGQSLYLRHQSIAFYVYISNQKLRLHWNMFSQSIIQLFTLEFFRPKSCYKNDQYKQHQKQRILNTFGYQPNSFSSTSYMV